MITSGFTGTMHVCLLKKTIALYHPTTCYKVYDVDKFSDNWNLYKAEFTHPKSILYLPSVEIWSHLWTKQYLNGRHHYHSVIWVNANICEPESSKRSYYSNNTLLKANQSKGRTYESNHVSAWLKLNPILVVPILVINLSHLGRTPALWHLMLFFAWLCCTKFLAKII